MHSHFFLMIIFALICSTVITLVTKNNSRDQWRYFVKFFLSLVLIALVLAWVMYPFPIR
jgi:cytochrome bd-type quinol oxidase subunit 2